MAEVVAVELPGHGTRIAEPRATRIAPLVKQVERELRVRLDARPYALFGHSFGALVAFELARRRGALGLRAPTRLLVSGFGAPTRLEKGAPMRDLPEPELLEAIARYQGTPEEALRHRELVDLVVPILRADLEAVETYVYAPGPRLKSPIDVFVGEDDVATARSEPERWCEQTTGPCALHRFAGGHFFVVDAREAVLGVIATLLSGG